MKFQHRTASEKWKILLRQGADPVCAGEDWIWFTMPEGPDGLIDDWGKVVWSDNVGDLVEES